MEIKDIFFLGLFRVVAMGLAILIAAASVSPTSRLGQRDYVVKTAVAIGLWAAFRVYAEVAVRGPDYDCATMCYVEPIVSGVFAFMVTLWTAARLVDVGQSFRWRFLMLIPLVNLVLVIGLWFHASKPPATVRPDGPRDAA